MNCDLAETAGSAPRADRPYSSVDESLIDAAEESGIGAEMQKKADLNFRCAQVGKQLRPGSGSQNVAGLDLDDYTFIDEQVVTICADRNAFVHNLN